MTACDPLQPFKKSIERIIEMTFRPSLTASRVTVLLMFAGTNAAVAKESCESFDLDLSRVYENQIFPADSRFVSLPEGWRVERSEFGAVSLLSAFGSDGSMVNIVASLNPEVKPSLEEVTASTVRSIKNGDGMSITSTGAGRACIADRTYEFSEIFVTGFGRGDPVRIELHSIASDEWRFDVQLWAYPDDSTAWNTLRTILHISKWH